MRKMRRVIHRDSTGSRFAGAYDRSIISTRSAERLTAGCGGFLGALVRAVPDDCSSLGRIGERIRRKSQNRENQYGREPTDRSDISDTRHSDAALHQKWADHRSGCRRSAKADAEDENAGVIIINRGKLAELSGTFHEPDSVFLRANKKSRQVIGGFFRHRASLRNPQNICGYA